MSDADKRIEHLLRQTGTRDYLPNKLPVRTIRWDGLRLECEHGDHADYLFPVDVVCLEPPEIIDGRKHSLDEPGHALIYTDGNVALTVYECLHVLWHVGRDGEWLSGGYLSSSYRLSARSVDMILKYCKEKGIGHLNPACEYPPSTSRAPSAPSDKP